MEEQAAEILAEQINPKVPSIVKSSLFIIFPFVVI